MRQLHKLYQPQLYISGVVVLLAIMALQIINIAEYSMRNDETLFVYVATHLNWTQAYTNEFFNLFLMSRHPPLYFMAVNLWIQLTGQSDYAMRILTLYASIFTASWLFRCGIDMSKRIRTGWFAALIYGTMGFIIYYTHQTYNYIPLTTSTIATFFFFLRWQKAPHRFGYQIGLIIAMFSVISMHYYGIFVAIALNIIAIAMYIKDWGRLKMWFKLMIITTLLYSPCLPIIYYMGLHTQGVDPIGYPSNWDTLSQTIMVMLSDKVWLYGFLLLAGTIFLIARYMRDKNTQQNWINLRLLFILMATMLLSTAAALIVNTKMMTFVDRRMIFLLPLFSLLLAYLLTAIPKRVGIGITLAAAMISYGSGWSSSLMGNWFYRHGIEQLATLIEADDVVYLQFSPPFDEHIIRYYADVILPDTTVTYTIPELDIRNPYNMDKFLDEIWLKNRFWVMRPQQDEPFSLMHLPERFQIEQTITAYWFAYDLVVAQDEPHELRGALEEKINIPVIFGNMFKLTDYQINKLEFEPGETITIYLDWQAQQLPQENYAVFVHLVNEEQEVIATGDNDPSHLGRIVSTQTWPLNTTIYDVHRITIPDNTLAGVYTIRIGWYSRAKPLRLTTTDNQDSITIANIEIR